MEAIKPSENLLQYLRDAKTISDEGRTTRFVLGNESADLDSMAAAVGYAYFATEVAPDGGAPFVPLINVPRADYKLRTEAVFLFSSVGITADLLTFIDEVDLDALQAGDGLELILVDHNVLSAAQGALADAVGGVVDHHKDEGEFAGLALRIVEPVGSACTLVAERLLSRNAAAVEAGLAQLLVGTILLDTVNLSSDAGRTTAKDVETATRLLSICGADRKELFERLQFEKFNVAALDTSDLLRKDYKEFEFGGVRCGIASVLMSATQWLDKDPDLAASLAEFAAARELDLLLAMNAYTEPEFRRDLVVWAADETLRQRVLEFLQGSELGLQPISHPDAPAVALFAQANAAYSRKKLQPLLQDLLA
ncbi:MAG: DHHA2 domain-containing protein [Gammaproteobacteria bacterium]